MPKDVSGKKGNPAARVTRSAGKSAKAEPVSDSSTGLEGKKAPTFVLPDREGRPVALKDLLKQGNLVLYFYPKDMTPGCTTEACGFRDRIDDIRKSGAVVVGISGDSSGSHQKFTDKYALNFPLLSDSDVRVAKAYGVYKKKKLYGREFMGIERTTFLIDQHGKIRKVFPKVKVSGHTDEIIGALTELER
ncbi:MAG: thioredoxin-dependent thiol peroxidase [Candidatus Binataceae bacterium]